jgi:hypothetical protein
MALAELPKVEIPKVESPTVEPSNIDMPAITLPPAGMLKVETKTESKVEPKIETKIQSKIDIAQRTGAAMKAEKPAAPRLELAAIEAPRISPEIGDIGAAAAQSRADRQAEEPAPEPPPAGERTRIVSRFTLLAASLALAAGLGGTIGALVATSLLQPGAPPVAVVGRTSVEEFQALKENVVQARVELAAIKATIDAGYRNASTQFTKIGERVDRIERQQAEPAAKLNKAIEAIERMSRADASAAKEVTGSVPSLPVSGAPKPLGSVDGWILRDVRRGTALIEGRMGIIEVDQGDVVPGLGRIDAIRKQADGRWVVVTTRGVISSLR